jgi:uncharacterized 2Fe-2S/4Fe-4S cluster protein (DUF4445 family)
VLLKEAEIKSDAIDQFVIAGAFGTYLDVKSAIRIGMFPHLPLERFRQTGNAVGSGTRMMLLSAKARRTSQELFNKARNLELTTYPGFAEIYIKALSFSADSLD